LKAYLRKYFSLSFFYFVIVFTLFFSPDFQIAQTSSCISDFEKNNFKCSFKSFYNDVDTNIDVKYYKLVADIRLNPKYLYGEVTINGVILNTTDSIYFDFSNNMAVDSVKYNGSSTNYNHYKDKISIHPNKSFPKNNSFSVVIKYSGMPVATGFGSFIFNTHNSTSVIWNLSEPYGASDWFPCKNSPSDKADSSDVWIICPFEFTGVSNGVLKEVLINSGNTKTYKWKNSYPIANYLLSVAVTNYSLYTNYFKYTSSDSMPVLHYVYPELLDSLKPTLDKTVDILKIFSNRFGIYPFIKEKYGHAQTGISGGMEHQTIASIGVFNEYVIAHELGHQWFGDKITCKDWHNIWLNEGFATYSEYIYVEDTYGKTAYDQYINAEMLNAKKAVGTIYVQDISSVSNIFNSYRSYAKGGMVLYMLRGIVGDSTFFNIMKTYASDTNVAYRTASTEDFQRVAENVYGKDLDYFFNEWIYGEGYPVYGINWSYLQKENEIYNITLTLTQKQSGTNPQYFTMPVDIKISTADGDTLLNIINNSLTQTYNFDVKGLPNLITVDPDNKILKDKNGDEPTVVVGYNLNQNYPNPFNPSTTINYEVAGYVNVKITLYDVLGRERTVLVDEKQKPGKYFVKFNGNNFASGVYFYKIEAGNYTNVKKMILLR
jgi:aminopeptidase N